MNRRAIISLVLTVLIVFAWGCARHKTPVSPFAPVFTLSATVTIIPSDTVSPTVTYTPLDTLTPTQTPTYTISYTPSHTHTYTLTPTTPPARYVFVPGGGAGVAKVWWCDVFDYDAANELMLSLQTNYGAGYPSYYSMAVIVYIVPAYTDCGQKDYLYPNGCAPMPNAPVVDMSLLKAMAKTMINWEGTGTAYDGRTPPIEGFFFAYDDFDYPPDAKSDMQGRMDAYAAIMGAEPPPESTFIYVDTTDGAVPAGDKSNYPTIDLSQAKLRGHIVIMGDADMNANETQGYSPAIDMQAPPGNGAGDVPWAPASSANRKPNINGLLYVRGDFGWAGGPVIYGAVICDGAFDAAGGIEVWYRYDFPYTGVSEGP